MRVYQASLLRVARVRFTQDASALSVIHRRSNRVAQLELQTGTTRPNVRFDHGEISAVAHAADGHLAIGTTSGFVQVVVGENERPLLNLRIGTDPDREADIPVSAVEFTAGSEPKRFWLAMASVNFSLWNPLTQEYIYAEADGDYRGVSFGPDGSFVASIEAHAHRLTAWDVKPFRVRFRTELADIGEFANGSVAVLPDGDRIVYAAADQLRCVSMSGGPGWEATLKRPAVDLALHPNGHALLVADGSKRVTQFDTDSGRPVNSFDWGVGKVSCVDVSRDGTLAAAGGEKGQVVVWDAE